MLKNKNLNELPYIKGFMGKIHQSLESNSSVKIIHW